NCIQLVGEVWEVRYGDERGKYPDRGNKCLDWLRKIISRPNRSLAVAEVLGDPEGKLAGDALLGGERETDKEGIAAIRKRLEAIDEVIEQTDGGDALESEKADLLARLEEDACGKQVGSPVQRAHHNIASQIRARLRGKLAKDMPKLAAHLTAALKL